jgi:hypothetical protein
MMSESKYVLVTDPEADAAERPRIGSLVGAHRWLGVLLITLVVGVVSLLAVSWFKNANTTELLHPQAILPPSQDT